MAISAKQKQKKLEKKSKKRKLSKKSLGKEFQFKNSASDYARYPIHECFVPSDLFETGLGYVIVTRRTPDRTIAISAFVVDVYCLGVKNALFKISDESEYEQSIKPGLMRSNEGKQFENIHSTCARKLIEGAVSYAKELGFSPHRDYKDAKGIFGEIDIESCPVKYTYGKDDEPFYIRGPNESINQVKKIVNQLSKKCGEGNFHYLAMLDEDIVE